MSDPQVSSTNRDNNIIRINNQGLRIDYDMIDSVISADKKLVEWIRYSFAMKKKNVNFQIEQHVNNNQD